MKIDSRSVPLVSFSFSLAHPVDLAFDGFLAHWQVIQIDSSAKALFCLFKTRFPAPHSKEEQSPSYITSLARSDQRNSFSAELLSDLASLPGWDHWGRFKRANSKDRSISEFRSLLKSSLLASLTRAT